jgi:hypothetical protein
MDMTYRQNKIRQAVKDLGVITPRIGNGSWYLPFRERKNYYRYSVDGEPKYDVFLDKKKMIE